MYKTHPAQTVPKTSSKILCCSDPQVLLIKQRLEVQHENELQKTKNSMSAEMKELTVLLQEQSEEKLRLAQQR